MVKSDNGTETLEEFSAKFAEAKKQRENFHILKAVSALQTVSRDSINQANVRGIHNVRDKKMLKDFTIDDIRQRLKDLKEKGLITCLGEEDSFFERWRLTFAGQEIINKRIPRLPKTPPCSPTADTLEP